MPPLAPHTLLTDIPWAGLDFESSGYIKGLEPQPIQIGFALATKTGIYQTYRSYLACTQEITWHAYNIHGISHRMLVGKPKLHELWPHIEPWWKTHLVLAHNTPTEKKFTKIFEKEGSAVWVDTLKLSRSLYPQIKGHTLSELLSYFGLLPQVRTHCSHHAHDALFDAVGSIVLAKRILQEHPLSLQDIQTLNQKEYHRLRRQKY